MNILSNLTGITGVGYTWESIKLFFVTQVIPNLLTAIIIALVGIFVVKIILKLVGKAFNKSKADVTVAKFVTSMIKALLTLILLIVILSSLGIPMTSLIAMLSVMGLAVSLAVQDSLSNVAGGLTIMSSQPFKVGDFIELDGISGVVDNISIVQTRLLTLDNKTTFIPNKVVSSGKIINYSTQDTRRVEIDFSIGYGDNFHNAIKYIEEIINAHEKILKTPEPTVRVNSLSAHSVDIAVRVWVESANYLNTKFDLLESVKDCFDENNISIPFNQLDVHIKDKE